MKKLISILFLAVAICSCSDKNELPSFDFGKGKFKEPYAGIFKHRPKLFQACLRHAPDTVVLSSVYYFSFDEQAVSNKSSVNISFTGAPRGLDFYFGGRKAQESSCKVCANSASEKVAIACKIKPSLGSETFGGNIYIQGLEKSKGSLKITSNGISTQEPVQISEAKVLVGHWSATQKIGHTVWRWIFYILWMLVMIVVNIGIVGAIMYLISRLL